MREFVDRAVQLPLLTAGSVMGAQLANAIGSARHEALIDFLVERRNKLNLTQAQVAARLGEYQSFVARLESGQRRVDVVEFLELAEILEFDPVRVIANLKEIS